MAVVVSRSAARLFLVALLTLGAGGAALGAERTDAVASRPVRREPLGLVAEPGDDNIFATRWRRVESDIRTELQAVALCRAEPENCAPGARQFIAIVDAARKQEGRARIGEINRAVNLAIRPMSDYARHGVADVWTAPLRTLASGVGDCEDYAIAKFAALREAGIAEADLRLMVVQEPGYDYAHAAVSVRLDGGWLMLDNRHFVMLDEKSVRARPVLALRAQDPSRPDDPAAPAAAANAGLQNFAGWSAPALLM